MQCAVAFGKFKISEIAPTAQIIHLSTVVLSRYMYVPLATYTYMYHVLRCIIWAVGAISLNLNFPNATAHCKKI